LYIILYDKEVNKLKTFFCRCDKKLSQEFFRTRPLQVPPGYRGLVVRRLLIPDPCSLIPDFLLDRKREYKLTSFTQCTFNSYVSMMCLNNIFAYRKSQARAAVFAAYLEKCTKYPFLVFF